jgi:hypothetical protein
MAITSLIVLAVFSAGIALGALESPDRFLRGKRTFAQVMGLLGLTVGHAIVLDQDLQRRGLFHKGGGYVFGALFAPPLAAVVYLVRVYRSRAVTLVPLYLGVVGTAALLGQGMGWLYLRV